MARTVHHDNGDVTVSWYGHEEMDVKTFAFYIVTFALLMLGLIMPSGVWGVVLVSVLGGALGACMAFISLLVNGPMKFEETYRAQN